MKALLILFSFVLLTSCAQQAIRDKKLSKSSAIGRALASDSESKDLLSQLFKRQCDKEKLEGCVALGGLEMGNDNLLEARRLFTKACNGNHMPGCTFIGMLELLKKGNRVEARKYFQQGCNGDDMSGCWFLAIMAHEDGKGAEAKKLTQKMCARDYQKGCDEMKKLLKGGKSSPAEWLRDKKSSLGEWFGGLFKSNKVKALNEACGPKDFRGCEALGRLEVEKGNLLKAKTYYEMGCGLSGGGEVWLDVASCFNLGFLNHFVWNNFDEARKLYTVVLRSCDAVDCGEMWVGVRQLFGLLELQSGNLDEARKTFKVACDLKFVWGCAGLAGVEALNDNYAKAQELMKKICDDGNDEVGNMSTCASVGDFESRAGNYLEGKKYFDKACAGSDSYYCQFVAEWSRIKVNYLVEAKKFHKNACDRKVMKGCLYLGELAFAEGNYVEAKKYHQIDCNYSKSGEGCFSLGLLALKEGNRDELKAHFKKFHRFLVMDMKRNACNANRATCEFFKGIIKGW